MLIRQAEWLMTTVQRPRVFARTVVVLTIMHNIYLVPGVLPALEAHAPWLLLMLSSAGPSKAVAATAIPFIPFVILSYIRLVLPKTVYGIAAHRTEMRSAAELESDSRWYDRWGARLVQNGTRWSEGAGTGAKLYRWLGYVRVDSGWVYMMVRKGHGWRTLIPWVGTVIAVEVVGMWFFAQWLAPHLRRVNILITIVVVGCLLKWVYKKMTAVPSTEQDDMAAQAA